MDKVFDELLEKLKEAEEMAFSNIEKSFWKYQMIYNTINDCRKHVEDFGFPSEQILDIETLILRHDGKDKQEVQL
jgi:hypothetical protein